MKMIEKLRKAAYRGVLEIGQTKLPCFVLEDGTRVISSRGMTMAIGMRGRGQGIARILTHKTLKHFIDSDLALAIEKPIAFLGYSPRTTLPSQGHEATILVRICEAVLRARDAGKLTTEQEKRYAWACDILVRSFAKVGIIALVDEATGYQEVRDRLALEKILEKFIAKELQPWAKRFPDEFYEQMFRLRKWRYVPLDVKRSAFVGRLTNDLVYSRLEKNVLTELRKITPRTEKGRLKYHFHRRLTADVGHPKLSEHLAGVMALMKASASWAGFYRMMQAVYPKFGENLPIIYDGDEGR